MADKTVEQSVDVWRAADGTSRIVRKQDGSFELHAGDDTPLSDEDLTTLRRFLASRAEQVGVTPGENDPPSREVRAHHDRLRSESAPKEAQSARISTASKDQQSRASTTSAADKPSDRTAAKK